MKLTKKEKKEAIERINEMMENFDDCIMCATEKHMIMAGTSLEMLRTACALIEKCVDNIPRQIVRQVVDKAINKEFGFEKKTDIEELKEMLKKLKED